MHWANVAITHFSICIQNDATSIRMLANFFSFENITVIDISLKMIIKFV